MTSPGGLGMSVFCSVPLSRGPPGPAESLAPMSVTWFLVLIIHVLSLLLIIITPATAVLYDRLRSHMAWVQVSAGHSLAV